MKNKNLILLKALLDSTSQWNVLRHCKDKKKKGRIIGAYAGLAILYLMLMAYSLFSCIGLIFISGLYPRMITPSG